MFVGWCRFSLYCNRLVFCIEDVYRVYGFFRSGLFGVFFVEVVGGGYFFVIYYDCDFEVVLFFEFILCQEFVSNGLAVFLVLFQQLVFVVVIYGFQFVYVYVVVQDFIDYEVFSVFVIFFQINCVNECFYCIFQYRVVQVGLIVFREQYIQFYFIVDQVE